MSPLYLSITFLSIVFLVAGLSKIRNLSAVRSFQAELNNLGVSHTIFRRLLSYFVPALELFISLALVAVRGYLLVAALAVAALLLATLTVVTLHHSLTMSSTPCRCFGFSSQQPLWMHMTVNATLMAAACLGISEVARHATPTSASIVLQVCSGATLAGLAILSQPIYQSLSSTQHSERTMDRRSL